MTPPFVQNNAHNTMLNVAAGKPVFAAVSQHRVPTRTRMIWAPRADGLHPGQVS